MGNNYQISVVMPLYNVEDCLKEAVDSVIGQSIGFINNIQIIFVNDGSTDGTEKICLRYKEKYPENIVYVSKPNGGVSSARNLGMKYAEGKYVNFFDGDDRWHKNAFKEAIEFIDLNYDEIDFVSCRICYFGDKEGFTHALDYKFDGNFVVNVIEKYDYIQLFSAPAIFKRSALLDVMYDEKIQYAEDIVFVNTILADKMKYGIVSSAVYFYRKQSENQSITTNIKQKRKWYLDTIEHVYKKIIQLSYEKFGRILPYFMYILMYEMQWRINYNEGIGCLSPEEQKEYTDAVIDLLRTVDDSIILGQKQIGQRKKLKFFELKYGQEFLEDMYIDNNSICYNKMTICSLTASSLFKIERLYVDENSVHVIISFSNKFWKDKYQLYIEGADDKYVGDVKDYSPSKIKNFTGESEGLWQYQEYVIPANDRKWCIYISENENRINKKKIIPKFDSTIGLDRNKKYSFIESNGYIVRFAKGYFYVYKRSLSEMLKRKVLYGKELLSQNNTAKFKNNIIVKKKTAELKNRLE